MVAQAAKPKLGISGAQCRGARAMLEMNQSDLAAAAQISRQTIVEFERGARILRPASLAALQTAFESAGVTFTHGREPGVKLKRSTK